LPAHGESIYGLPLSDQRLHEFLRAGRAAWPRLGVDAEAFGAFVAERPDALPRHAPDLYLAFACSRGDGQGLHALDELLRGAAQGAATRIHRSPGFSDEVAQALRERLIVSRPPKIASYGGRASLRTWLGISALRAAQNLRRGRDDRGGNRAALEESATAGDGNVEREYLRARYRTHFVGAVQRALGALSQRERAILRAYLGERIAAEELAVRFGVGKSTMTRWIRLARERLIDETRQRLCELLRITRSEYESLAAVVRSEIDMSVVRLLGEIGSTR
jgi:RNA polymerase sigma-70 factor (ECF subfamily)